MAKRGNRITLFSILITILFLLSSITAFAQNQNLITGNAAVQTISFVKAGHPLSFEIRNVPCISGVEIEVVSDIKDGKITFDEGDSIPFSGTKICQFRIFSEQENKFGETILSLKVRESDLTEKKLKKDEISLYLGDKELLLKITKILSGYVYYTATGNNLGNFVVGKKTAAVTVPKTDSKESIAGKAAEIPAQELPPVLEEPAAQPVVQKESFWTKVKNFFKGLKGIFN